MGENRSAIIIGCDHGAVELKTVIKRYLEDTGVEVADVGTHGTSSVDYPEYGCKVSAAVSKGDYARGVLLCGTGLGMSMVANRFSGVRAALCNDLFSARMSREHNDANILVMGGRVVGEALALEIVKYWLETPFGGGRHQKRLDQFDGIPTCG